MKKTTYAVDRLKVVVHPKELSELTPISHLEYRVVQCTHLAFEQYHYVAEEVPTKPQFAVVRIEQVPYDRRLLPQAPRAMRQYVGRQYDKLPVYRKTAHSLSTFV